MFLQLMTHFALQVPEWLTYDFPPDVKAKLTALWGTEWNGQAQKWFVDPFLRHQSPTSIYNMDELYSQKAIINKCLQKIHCTESSASASCKRINLAMRL